MKSTLWKSAHGRLLTNSERMKRGIAPNDLCPRCQAYPETLMHMLRDCEYVHDIWSKNINHDHCSKFFSLGLYAWMEWNLSQNDIGLSR